jgi:hypothetical protein
MLKEPSIILSGLIEAIESAGHSVSRSPDGWQCSDEAGVQIIIDGYDSSSARLSFHQGLKLDELSSVFEAKVLAGLTHQGAVFQIDEQSRANIAAMATFAISANLGGPWPKDFYWIAADNTHVPMSSTEMLAFAQAAGAYVSSLILKQRGVKDAIAAATSVAEVDAIDPAVSLST